MKNGKIWIMIFENTVCMEMKGMDEFLNFLKSKGKVTLTLVAVNILIFFVLDFKGDTENGLYILEHGGAYAPLILENKEYYRLFTAMFLHFGIEHLFSNMLTLIFLGDMLEKMIGKIRFILIYFLGGLAGNLLSLAKEMVSGVFAVSAGASGAIFSVMGALVFIVVRNRGKIPGISSKRLVFMALLTLADGFMSTKVDYMAHLGGMIAGFLLAAVLAGKERRKEVPVLPE